MKRWSGVCAGMLGLALAVPAFSAASLFDKSEYAARRGRRTDKIPDGAAVLLGAAEPANDHGASFKNESDSKDQISSDGLMGYISSRAPQPSAGYGAGIGFYVAVYPILPEPIESFQIGLASTWIVPKNSDNTHTPLCPPGTYARDNWPERAPTFGAVFQTIEGGLGLWESTQFRAAYKPPKFQIVAVPDCYSGNYLISPGWSDGTTATADDKMGIAQLSNRILLPPDGLTFQNTPRGELFGYSWMALPLADEKKDLPLPETSIGLCFWPWPISKGRSPLSSRNRGVRYRPIIYSTTAAVSMPRKGLREGVLRNSIPFPILKSKTITVRRIRKFPISYTRSMQKGEPCLCRMCDIIQIKPWPVFY